MFVWNGSFIGWIIYVPKPGPSVSFGNVVYIIWFWWNSGYVETKGTIGLNKKFVY